MRTTAPYPSPDALITAKQFAARMGLSPTMIRRFRAKHGDAFPAPLIRVGDAHLYLTAEARDWAITHGRPWNEPATSTQQ